jgi:hypothetical protein
VHVKLPLSRDAAEAWESGLDDSLTDLAFHLDCGSGSGEVRIDDLRFDFRKSGEALRRIQQDWMEDYPNVAHAFGEEISQRHPHLNRYGAPREWVDYERMWEEVYVESVVERIHRGGGLVAWCHPFGLVGNPETLERYGPTYRRSMLDRALGGVDMLEVGFRNKARAELAEYLAFWDESSRRGVRVVGIGVNDSHESMWGPWENNFGTWIAAPAEEEALLAALSAGNVFFGDPVAFRGNVSIRSGDSRAGDVISGATPRTVEVSVAGAPVGSHVRLTIDGETREDWPVVGDTGLWEVALPSGSARWVRAEVRDAQDRPLAFTNPLWFRGVDSLDR